MAFPFAVRLGVLRVARPAGPLIPGHVGVGQRVSVLADPQSLNDLPRTHAPSDVFERRHGFEMQRVHTCPVSAEVVQLKSARNWPM